MKINKIFQVVFLTSIIILINACTVIKYESPWLVNDRCSFTTKVTNINKAYTTFTIINNPYKKKCDKLAKYKNQITYIPYEKITIREDILKELSLSPKIDQQYKVSFGIFYTSNVPPRINEFRINQLGDE